MPSIVYRKSNPSAHLKNAFKDAPLTLAEIDGNFKSIDDNKLEFDELLFLFEEYRYWIEGGSIVYAMEGGKEYTVLVSEGGKDYKALALK